jgi:hypothetical protein
MNENQTLALITSSLNNHLNFGQNFIMNTPEVFMSLERTSTNLLSNKTIGNAQINFPLNFDEHQNILFRLKLDALAPFGNSRAYTNLSRSLSLSIFHRNGSEILIKTKDFIEFIIPRDPNMIFPEMILQNVLNHHQSFYYKFLDLKKLQANPNLTISVHFQIQSLNKTLAYLFVYHFDHSIQFTDSKFFCPSNNETIYQYYIDNQQISTHQSLVFGLRELTSTEFDQICLQNSTENFSIENKDSYFTSNYYLRIYTSGCYYLDQDNHWQSDGLLVCI